MAPGRRHSLISLRTMSKVAILLGFLGVVGIGAVSTGAYTTIDASRGANVGVSTDNPFVELDRADTVIVGQRSKLVTITNGFNQQIHVTVTLVDRRTGKLFARGDMQDESITVTLAPGASETIDLRANNRKDPIRYTIDASGDGVSVSLSQKSIDVETGGGGPTRR